MRVLRAENIGKKLSRQGRDRPLRLRELLTRATAADRASQEFWAVRDVSLELRPGEMLGVIGRNGAGKSTLLRLLGGVLEPTQGTVHRSGRTEAFFDFTAGLRSDLTCRDNIVIGLIIGGCRRKEAVSLVDRVLDFAGLIDYRNSPARVLSSGMRLRLGFAIVTERRPELLLLDEVVAVGDAVFQKKSYARINDYRRAGTAAVLVSHNMQLIRSHCERAIWLDNGRVARYGPVDDVTKAYVDNTVK